MPRAFLDDLEVIAIGGTTIVDKILGFFANTVFVENYTSQWVFVAGLSFVPPYTSRLIGVGGVQRARIQFGAPPGVVQVASISGQICNSTWSERDVPQLGGAVGPIGVTSNYYDRNPKSFVLNYSAQSIGPHVNTSRVTYTVPANRKAFIEVGTLRTVFESVGDLALGSLYAFFQFTLVAGAPQSILSAYSEGLCPVRTTSEVVAAAPIELQPGEKIDGVTTNGYTATIAAFQITLKGTEFDA